MGTDVLDAANVGHDASLTDAGAQPCDAQSAASGVCRPLVEECVGRVVGEPFCNGERRIVCGVDLVSSTVEICRSAEHCAQATGVGCAACLRDEFKCQEDELSVCAADGTRFVPSEVCSDGECNAELGRCGSSLCNPGAYDCRGNTLVRCDPSGATLTAVRACGDEECDALNRRCSACRPSVNTCVDSKTLALCDERGSRMIESCGVNQVCAQGQCQDLCEPDKTSCDGKVLKQCRADGQGYLRVTDCGLGYCSESDEQCVANPCLNGGTARQVGRDSYECSCATGYVDANCQTARCVPGERRCSTTTKNPEQCLSDESWLQVETCDTPHEICRATDTSVACAANHPYDVSSYIDTTRATNAFNPVRDKLYAESFVVTKTARLIAFRVQGTASVGACRMALFSNSNSDSPGTKLAQSESVLVGDVPSGSATNTQIILSQGATYWLAAECDDLAQDRPPDDNAVPLLKKSRPGHPFYAVDHVYGTFIPNSFPASPRLTGTTFSFFVQVQDVP